MRQLKIRREKTSISPLKKDYVYIEDPVRSDAVIEGVSCRLLGIVKNGEEQTFSVGGEAARVFVTTGKAKKRLRGDSFQLPAGEEDVFLTGSHPFDLVANGAFSFGPDNSPEGKKKSRRKTIITLVLVIICTALGSVFGRQLVRWIFDGDRTAEKTFTANGLTITLTDGFKEESSVQVTTGFSSKDVYVVALREPFTLLPGSEDMTVEEYAELVKTANNRTETVQKYGDLTGFDYDYEGTDGKSELHSRIFMFKEEEAFWTVQFITLRKDFEKYADRINTWAASVRFDGP